MAETRRAGDTRKIGHVKTPTLEQCQAFLNGNTNAELFSGRTAKELQDKCRTIMTKELIFCVFLHCTIKLKRNMECRETVFLRPCN